MYLRVKHISRWDIPSFKTSRLLVDYETYRSEMKLSNVFIWPILLDLIFWNLLPFSPIRRTSVRHQVKNEIIFSKSKADTIDRGPRLLFCKQKQFGNTEPSLLFLNSLFGSEWAILNKMFTSEQNASIIYTHFGESLYLVGFAKAKPFLFV